uniref:SGNH hydrolase-type esterase domain-containing protein n=1 Tax=Poecilia latipinna TaxID=48699 RepID=A0A3B3W1V4_9TELE
MKIKLLEVNFEINATCQNETTLPQINGEVVRPVLSSSPWNAQDAKPKRESCTADPIKTGRTLHLDESPWPVLSLDQPSTSTPAPPKQAAANITAPPTPLPKTKQPARTSKHPDSVGIPLKNRFSAPQPEPLGETSASYINNEAAWPALSRNPPSTPTPALPKNSKQAAGTKTDPPTPLPRTKRPAQASKHSNSVGIPLKNRFSAHQHEPLRENPPSNTNNKAKQTHSPPKAPKDKVTTRKMKGMPRVLIVGDETVNGISHVCNPKKTRVVSFLGDTVSDLTRKVLSLTADQPNIETLVVHVGANDLAKQKSEILKKDFNILLDTLGKFKTKLFLSGPIPSPQWGEEKHSRLGMINKWLIKTCSASSVTFIYTLWIYWQRFHLFGRGGRNLNKHGIRLLTNFCRIFNFFRTLK